MTKPYAIACEGEPYAQACADGSPYAKACTEPGCWVAGIICMAGTSCPNPFYVPGDNEAGADSDANEGSIGGGVDQDDCPTLFSFRGSAAATIRSSSPAGTVLSISFDININASECGDSSGTKTLTFSLTVGSDSGGTWSRGPSFAAFGATIQTWIVTRQIPAGTISATPAPPVIVDHPPFCEWSDEWCDFFKWGTIGAPYIPSCGTSIMPWDWGDPALFSDAASWANALCGLSGPCANYYGTSTIVGNTDFEGAVNYVGTRLLPSSGNFYKIDDPPLTVEQPTFNVLNASFIPSGGVGEQFPDVPSGPNVAKIPSFNRCAFTPPAGPLTTDDLFDLESDNYNPYNATAVDGTHGDCGGQAEADTMPYIALDGGDACGEGVYVGSGLGSPAGNPTRLSYGKYKWTNLRLNCQAGPRSFSCAPFHLQPGGSTLAGSYVTSVPVSSGSIMVNPGAPANLDMPQGFHFNQDPGCPLLWFRINQPLVISGADVIARILDQVGETCPFNVCTGDSTDTILLTLFDNTTGAWSGPVLNGTVLRTVAAGIADFPGLSVTGLGPGSATSNTCVYNYGICASSPTSPGLGTSSYNGGCLGIGLTAGLAFHGGNTLSVAHGVPVTIEVDLVDYGGATISPATPDPITLADGSPASGFTGLGSVTPTAGVALFSGTFPTPGTYVLSASTAGTNYYGPGSPAPGQTDPAITITVTVT